MTRPIPTSTTRRPLAVDLFAGVGGLSLGIEAAGFEIAFSVESDRHTAAQYQNNFPHTLVLCADISQFSGQEIRSRIRSKYPDWDGQLALVCGGPPCQGFSRMGRRDPADPRNQLIAHFVRLVGELQPAAFVMENVSFLEDSRYAELLSNTRAQLHEFNYKTSSWLLNAADFGVPQSRERVFWVGTLLREIPAPVPTACQKTTVRDAIASLAALEPFLSLGKDSVEISHLVHSSDYSLHLDNLFIPQDESIAPQTLTGCALTQHSPQTVARFAATSPGAVEPISRFPRLAWNGLAPTLRAGTASDKGGHTAARPIHPEFHRVITVREAARLHSFPDWFQFDPTKWRGLRQVGNAVPPLLALAVGRQVIQAISTSTKNVCGVDEVGRGCLFGPVVSCALILKPEKVKELIAAGVKDSKLILNPERRRQLAAVIKEACVDCTIGFATSKEIDAINIRNASLLSMQRAVSKLKVQPEMVLVDGNATIPDVNIPQQAIVDGDQKEVAIAAASIVAKVWRDDLMTRLGQKYPEYGIAQHKGYDVPAHRAALHKYGATRLHRRSFEPVLNAISQRPIKTNEVPTMTQTANLQFHFDYNQFQSEQLASKATTTLGNFLGYVRASFDGLVEQGERLWDFYYDCCTALGCLQGKQTFDEWLKSDDFGASRYIAKAAMDISSWFHNLKPRLQALVRRSVQKWSVAALVQLTKVANDLVKELVKKGKQTAASIKDAAADTGEPKLRKGGYAEVLTDDRRHLKGQIGQLIDKPDSIGRITLKMPDGAESKFFQEDLKPVRKPKGTNASNEETFTRAQVEEMIIDAIAQREREKAEEEIARHAEIRDAALAAAKAEIQAAHEMAQKLTAAKATLVQQLQEKERELAAVLALKETNIFLEQRVADLEKALLDAKQNSWGNTFNKQAAKVINSELEQAYQPLVDKLSLMEALVEQQAKEINKLRANTAPQPDLPETSDEDEKLEAIAREFGEAAEAFGIPGWTKRGYRAEDNMLYTGLDAIKKFKQCAKALSNNDESLDWSLEMAS